jgi:GT2 family glycosyltransferase
MNPLIYLIVLNWNNYPDTLRCLESLAHVQEPPFCVIVVDNGSDDGSETHIRARFPDVTLLQTGQNLGYAGGNNVGIRYALEQGADYVGILNNDVTVAPRFLGHLSNVLQDYENVGVATPLIAEMAHPERVWALGAEMRWRAGDAERLHIGDPVQMWTDHAPFEIDIAPGTAMLAKREVFERVGFLDELYYLYFEEVDWCLHVRQAKYGIYAVPHAVVSHKVSATLGPTSPLVDYYMLRNQIRLIMRWYSGINRLGILVSVILHNILVVTAYMAKRRDGYHYAAARARLGALRDAFRRRWGRIPPDIEAICRSMSL